LRTENPRVGDLGGSDNSTSGHQKINVLLADNNWPEDESAFDNLSNEEKRRLSNYYFGEIV